MFDTDKTEEISFNEFGSLWRYVIDWQNCFKSFDKDKSGTINQVGRFITYDLVNIFFIIFLSALTE